VSFASAQSVGKVYLNRGRDFSARNLHPWLFSGAINKRELDSRFVDGAIVQVYSAENELLGHAFYNSKVSLALRFINFGAKQKSPADIIKSNLDNALSRRAALFDQSTTCKRLVNAEGDMLPGLVIDQYDSTLVLQSSIRGTDLIKNEIVDYLVSTLAPKTIYEKSSSSSRRIEELEVSETLLYGAEPQDQLVLENGMSLLVNVKTGQKTGFFIDQREMRSFVRQIAKDKSVLNCFSYSGAFSVAALQAGAKKVISVDASEVAIDLCAKNISANGFTEDQHQAICSDAFEFIENTQDTFDIIIVDPPAFAKGKKDLRNALKAYYRVNLLAAKRLRPGGILIACSCSHFVSEGEFIEEVTTAVKASGRIPALLGFHRQALDHPVLASHPEGAYLKSLILSAY
jgi:23S rRNA (cytosine1962-C5)-methyltransferase